MSLCLDKSEESSYLRFCARFCGVKTSSAANGEIRLKVGNVVLHEIHTIVRHFARAADRENELCGNNPVEHAEVAEWMAVASILRRNKNVNAKAEWERMDLHLVSRVYFVGNRPTLADATVFWVIYQAFQSSVSLISKNVNLRRWFNQLQHTVGIRGFEQTGLIPLTLSNHLLIVQVLASPAAPEKTRKSVPDESAPVVSGPVKSFPAKDDGAGKGKLLIPKDKQAETKMGDKPKKEKKTAAAPTLSEGQAEITKLDIRVGKITKVWKHEKADRLYCEEIDVGEDAPRQIASGLVDHYSLKEMEGRMLLVMCNLKPRALVGFKSHGMVLCAVSTAADGTEKVALVEPPAHAKIGERIVFEDLTGAPLTPAQVEKQKVLVAAGEHMKSNDEGVAMWKNHVFMTSAGPCKSPSIRNGILR